jgi:hypothetical protein
VSPSTPFSRLPQPDPPRGKRRDWPADYRLPTRLELGTHGLWERGLACYGFAVWDVGHNRLLIRHGAPIGRGRALDTVAASHHALLAGLTWLVREEQHRRRLVVGTDNPLAYAQLEGHAPAPDRPHGQLVGEVRRTLTLFPQQTLQLMAQERNSQAIAAADQAYVSAQEAGRLARAAEVLPELRPAGPDLYLVGQRYRVDLAAGTCNCPDFRRVHTERHPVRCKHLLAALQLTGNLPTADRR